MEIAKSHRIAKADAGVPSSALTLRRPLRSREKLVQVSSRWKGDTPKHGDGFKLAE
jgi:hypothetical protein